MLTLQQLLQPDSQLCFAIGNGCGRSQTNQLEWLLVQLWLPSSGVLHGEITYHEMRGWFIAANAVVIIYVLTQQTLM